MQSDEIVAALCEKTRRNGANNNAVAKPVGFLKLHSAFQAARMPAQAIPRRLMNFWFFMGYPVLVPK